MLIGNNKVSHDKSSQKMLLPKEIVSELDKHVIGHKEAKRTVAIALRNRYRRMQISDIKLRSEITPKNILMIGSTGVGKTEIARRLSKLIAAPFLKVEATKFTEIGYIGRDVESIIRDLVDVAMSENKKRAYENVRNNARKNAVEKILSIISKKGLNQNTEAEFRHRILQGDFDEEIINIEIKDLKKNKVDQTNIPGAVMGVINIGEILGKALGGDKKMKKNMKVKDAINHLIEEESEKLTDEDMIKQQTILSVETEGIVFIDEIDKIVSNPDSSQRRGEVSREGVQRDLLPLLEGTSVTTKYGVVNTDYILFICSGAFHISKPSDLLPELQGRLPVKVQLKSLQVDDMYAILTRVQFNLIEQYTNMLLSDNIQIKFTNESMYAIAVAAININNTVENIGARRLNSILEKVLEEISYECKKGEYLIEKDFVAEKIQSLYQKLNMKNSVL